MCESIAQGGARCSAHSSATADRTRNAYLEAYGDGAVPIDVLIAASSDDTMDFEYVGELVYGTNREFRADLVSKLGSEQGLTRIKGLRFQEFVDYPSYDEESVRVEVTFKAVNLYDELKATRFRAPGQSQEEHDAWVETQGDMIERYYKETFKVDGFDTEALPPNEALAWADEVTVETFIPADTGTDAASLAHALRADVDVDAFEKAHTDAKGLHLSRLHNFLRERDSELDQITDGYMHAMLDTERDTWVKEGRERSAITPEQAEALTIEDFDSNTRGYIKQVLRTEQAASLNAFRTAATELESHEQVGRYLRLHSRPGASTHAPENLGDLNDVAYMLGRTEHLRLDSDVYDGVIAVAGQPHYDNN